MLSPPSLIQHHRQPAGGGKALEGLENRSGAAILKPVEWKHHCGSGGTGRRARLRILWPKGRGGSNPSFRTKFSAPTFRYCWIREWGGGIIRSFGRELPGESPCRAGVPYPRGPAHDAAAKEGSAMSIQDQVGQC